MAELKHKAELKILSITFSPSNTHLAISTTHGFIMYSIYPLKQLSSAIFNGGISLIAPLWEQRLVLLVGGGAEPAFSRNELHFWDDARKEVVRVIKLSEPIVSLRAEEDMVAVGVSKGILVYKVSSVRICDQLPACEKWNGCMALSTGSHRKLLVWPHKQQGSMAIKFYEDEKVGKQSVIPVSSSEIVCISVNTEGTLIAAATKDGTMIRVYNSDTGELMQELRRGSYKCTVHQILFHKSNKYLLCTSNRKSVHIFMLKNTGLENSQELLKLNPKVKNKTSR
eukprot:TRINITY_DN9540_c0_g4_i5.p1 TRINITY_DN9540_c0_g4~~TRINITY_DN9540_c0_g4_i5.p1  ORF type:complete len:282 (-),score=57.92 TRINITY_DN9540_c0_g4_i5:390-1235(-)